MVATKPLDLRSNLKKYMDCAFSGEIVVITRPKQENVVMISEDAYNKLEKASRNAEYLEHLDRSYQQHAANQTITFSLEELREMESDDWKPTQKVKEFMEQVVNE
ncbi:MAG: type II toxin-antitoxin system Phd/YefM family antitoxin [Eubacteriales bacterium]|nr:type II toxin-antitoxin system Phd/YefM family antitoxin [Eubacteriales bacterium]